MLKKLIAKLTDKMIWIFYEEQYNAFRKKYDLSTTFRFNGKGISMYGEGEIIGGEYSYVGEYSTWQAAKAYKIVIGKKCKIGHNVRCYTQSAMPDYDFSRSDIPEKFGDVIIGDYVWIGANVFINPGIEIGNNSVIGANSVVTKNVPENAIVGGVPAKVIRFKNL
jgi:maltose O-acetyltransferase